MAKTSYSIYLDYQRAIKQADKLDEAARKIKKEKTRLAECRGGVGSAWKGDNSSAFRKKMRVVENNLSDTARSIQSAADTIRRIAKETYQAEQKALALAKQRKA